MGHQIHAIIGAREIVAQARALGLDAPMIALGGELAWVPVSDDALDALAARTSLPVTDWDRRFVYLGSVLTTILTQLSRLGPVAYIETDYFGGAGRQDATAFIDGVRVLEHGTVNQALRMIGVVARATLDEWDTVGLGQHRQMPES